MKKWIFLIIAVAVIGLGLYFKSQGTEVEYVTEAVQKGNLTQTVSATGKVAPTREVQVHSETSGKVDYLNIEVGKFISEGEIVAKIDNSVLISQLNEARIALEIQEQQEKLARRKWDLLKREEKETIKKTTDKARASIQTLQTQISKSLVYSPMSGIVVKKHVEKGELVSPNAPLAVIITENDLRIESLIPESDISKIKVGQSAMITFDAFTSEDKFQAKIIEIDPSATIIQDVVYYGIKLELLDKNDQLRSGMSADIEINAAEKDNVIMIPERAVFSEGGKESVKVLVDEIENKINVVKVETGFSGDNGMIEIISGLKEGDKVVTFSK